MSELMTKHEMTEEDIKLQYITPAIESAGWDKLKQIKMEYNFTDGRVIVRGNVTARGKRKRTDYLLYYKPNIPLAIVEAKDNRHSVGAGMQQAIEYAEVLDIPFVYSSNGDGFLEHDMKSGKERELMLEQFPSPHDLWQRHIGDEHFTPEQEQLITEPYYFQLGDKTPRYYQRIAINRTVDAVARGQDRILLVMATGTGKTYTAFQIIHHRRLSYLCAEGAGRPGADCRGQNGLQQLHLRYRKEGAAIPSVRHKYAAPRHRQSSHHPRQQFGKECA